MKVIRLSAFAILFTLVNSCLETFNPQVEGVDGGFLVVDARITDEEQPNRVILSRSFNRQNDPAQYVSGAQVAIMDQHGTAFNLVEEEPGFYYTSASEFRGKVNDTYTLEIQTVDGNRYQSHPATMLPVPEISRIHYEKDKGFFDNGEVLSEGIQIYIDVENPDMLSPNFRWEYQEDWSFGIPFPQKLSFDEDHNPMYDFVPQNSTCYDHSISRDIIVFAGSGNQSIYRDLPITFVPSDQSYRLSLRYRIEIRQYSLSEEEYAFWNNLKMTTEETGNIFERQPFEVLGNIFNIDNPAETVLGYFSVSAVTQKELYISADELTKLELPPFVPGCTIDSVAVNADEYAGLTLKEKYQAILLEKETSGFLVFDGYGMFFPGVTLDPDVMYFGSDRCVDCNVTASYKQPPGWIDN